MFFLQEIVLDVLQVIDFFSNNILDTKTKFFDLQWKDKSYSDRFL